MNKLKIIITVIVVLIQPPLHAHGGYTVSDLIIMTMPIFWPFVFVVILTLYMLLKNRITKIPTILTVIFSIVGSVLVFEDIHRNDKDNDWKDKISQDPVFIYAPAGITDQRLIELVGLTKLEELRLSHSLITGTGLIHLKSITTLTNLDLSWTKITDQSLIHVKELKQLKELKILGTNITDSSYDLLSQMSNLERLEIIDTKLSDEKIKALKQQLPNCEIIYEY